MYHHAMRCQPNDLYSIIEWLSENFDPATWDWDTSPMSVVFYFKNEDDLNWFLLRWG